MRAALLGAALRVVVSKNRFDAPMSVASLGSGLRRPFSSILVQVDTPLGSSGVLMTGSLSLYTFVVPGMVQPLRVHHRVSNVAARTESNANDFITSTTELS